MAESKSNADFSSFIGAFRRRLRPLLIVFAVAVVLSAAYAFLATPMYNATALVQLQVGKGESAAAGAEPGAGGAQPDQAQLDTEVGNIGSSEVARAVAKRLNLVTDAEFGADPADPDALDKTGEEVLKAVSVARSAETYLVGITARSRNPNKAALIANAFADEALRLSAERRSGAASAKAEALGGQLTTLGQQIREEDAKLAAYRAANGLTDDGGINSTDQELGSLASELAQAQSEAAQRTAELNQTQSRGNSSDSPLLTELSRQRAQLIQQQGYLASRLGPNHPQIIALNRQLSDINAQIGQERGRSSAQIASVARAAQARLGTIQGRMNALQGRQANQTRESVTANSMAREVDAKRRVYNSLAQQQQQSAQEGKTAQPVGQVATRANAPERPASPNRPLILLLGGLVGAFGGIATVLGAEALDHRVRSGTEIEKNLRTTYISAVPRLLPNQLEIGDGETITPWDFVFRKPMSLYSESLRTVRRTLKLSRQGSGKSTDRAAVVAICSSVPAEGKSNFSASLGRIMAQSGDRVILIDGDLRRSTLRGLMTNPPEKGLVEVLIGDVPLDDAIVRDDLTALDLLPLAEATFLPEDLFERERFDAMLEKLRDRYDYILIDTPPLLAVDDGRGLATIADQVVLLIRWNSTTVHQARASVRRLRDDGAPLVGAVLTLFEKKAGMLNAAESVYYDKSFSKYYME